MNFASRGSSEAKAWRDIWGSGQGIGAVREVQSAAELVTRLEREYAEAMSRGDVWAGRGTGGPVVARPGRR